MSQDDLPITLDDAAIKQAVRATWGNHAASPDLRRRTLMALTRTVLEEPDIPQSTRSRRFWDRWPRPVQLSAAIAALLILAVGVSWTLLEIDTRPSRATAPRAFITPPAQPTLYALLISRHDDFSAGSESAAEDVPPTADQLPAVRDALATQHLHPVWTPNLARHGWKFTGVRVYPVNGVTAVAFNFRRGSDQITAFSLPVAPPGDDCIGGHHPDIDLLVDNRSVAAFFAEGQLFALVGSRNSTPFPQTDLRALLNQFRDDPTARSSCPIPPI